MKLNKAKKIQEQLKKQIPLVVMTNEPSQLKINILQMMYHAADLCQLAYMDGMDPDTGEIVPLLIGLQPTENNEFQAFPLARILSKHTELKQYLVPDGNGSYIDYSRQSSSDEAEEAGPSVESGQTETS